MTDEQVALQPAPASEQHASSRKTESPSGAPRSLWSILDETQETLAKATSIVDLLALNSEADQYASCAATIAFQMLDEAADNVRLAADLARDSHVAESKQSRSLAATPSDESPSPIRALLQQVEHTASALKPDSGRTAQSVQAYLQMAKIVLTRAVEDTEKA